MSDGHFAGEVAELLRRNRNTALVKTPRYPFTKKLFHNLRSAAFNAAATGTGISGIASTRETKNQNYLKQMFHI
jgi:hypothetical protein